MTLNDEQVQARLAALPGWRRDGEAIVCDLQFENFSAAMAFVNLAAERAEAADHHPDILIHGWNKVRLRLLTHDRGGLTEKDFALAAEIERLLPGA